MKKVAFFIGEITKEYQVGLVTSTMKAAKEHGIKLFIFTNHGTYGANVFSTNGEKSVMQIPDLTSFDGIIAIPDTHEVENMGNELVQKIKQEATCPVVCLRTRDNDFYSIIYDDFGATQDLVEHFIDVHHFTRIAYMTGTISSPEAKQRLKAYLKVMGKHDFPIEEHRIFYGNYWKNRGQEAVDWFLDESVEWPQAIVCANDYMAISICDELKARGIKVPEQICVAGYDDLEEARCYYPPITSMRVDGTVAGSTAIDILLHLWNREDVDKTISIGVNQVLRASCGCGSAVDEYSVKEMFEQKEAYRRAVDQITFMFTDFENTHTFTELMGKAQSGLVPAQYNEIYVCLCDENQKKLEKEEYSQRFTDHMALKAILHADGVDFLDQNFERKNILPEQYLEDCDAVIIATLHEKNECLGYVVIKTEQVQLMDCLFKNWLIGFSNALCRLKMYEDNQMLEEIRSLYLKDTLTGILNRRGFETKLQFRVENFKKNGIGFCFFSIDMDGLKHINDNFGHSAGDEAISSFAAVLKRTVGGKGDCARVGGDEFSVCLPVSEIEKAEEFCDRLRNNIDEWNEKNKKQYLLSASIGYAFSNKYQNMSTCMDVADRNMYIDKVKRKKSRVD